MEEVLAPATTTSTTITTATTTTTTGNMQKYMSNKYMALPYVYHVYIYVRKGRPSASRRPQGPGPPPWVG